MIDFFIGLTAGLLGLIFVALAAAGGLSLAIFEFPYGLLGLPIALLWVLVGLTLIGVAVEEIKG